MTLQTRIRAAVRVLLHGEARPNRKTPIPPLSQEDLQDFHRFFPARSSLSSGTPVPEPPC